MLDVPVLQQLMVRRHDPAKLIDTVSEVYWFEQQKLNYEEADLSLISFVVPHRHAEDQPVEADDVELPDHAVHGVNALVNMTASSRLAELMNKKITETSEMSSQLFCSYSLQHLHIK